MTSECPTINNLAPEQEARTVAIIGLGALFPGQPGLNGYWSVIKSGLDTITEIPKSRWSADDYYDPDPQAQDKTYCRRGAFLSPVAFDPLKFGITPRDLPAIDSTQLLGLVAADAALTDAGYPVDQHDHSRTAVIVGVTGALKMVVSLGSRLAHPQLRKALADSGVDQETALEVLTRFSEQFVPWQEVSFPGLLGNVVAGRIANRLNLGGANLVVDAACASSLAAISQAVLELQTGRADLVVSGGLDTFSDPFMFTCFSKTPALSKTGDIRSFDQSGDGTMLGEGLGVVILKRLAEARKDGDRIYALIRSIGGASDGRGTAIFAPSPKGQIRALQTAFAEAELSPATVELVEGHGTGTAVGDSAELSALTDFFHSADKNQNSAWCALGSVKSQIGHTKAAAGVAGLIKATLALHHKILPPTIKVTTPLSELSRSDCPFFINNQARPWLARPDHPRRAGVSAFGFGGSNFHCILEETSPIKPLSETDYHIIPISGRSVEDLFTAVSKLDGSTPEELDQQIRPLIKSFRSSDPLRLVFLLNCPSPLEHFTTRLTALKNGDDQSPWPADAFFGQKPQTDELWFAYPGHGQRTMMFKDLALSFPAFQNQLDRASRLTGSKRLGLILYPPDLASADLRHQWLSDITGPLGTNLILPAVEMGLTDLFLSFGLKPAYVSGQGTGSLVALYAAGFISADEVLAQTRNNHPQIQNGTFPRLLHKGKPLTKTSEIQNYLENTLNNPELEPETCPGQRIWLGPGIHHLSPDGPTSLALVLAELGAQGRPVDFSQWPLRPKPDKPAPAHAVYLTGANYFEPPEPKPSRSTGSQAPILTRILEAQHQTISLLGNLTEKLGVDSFTATPKPVASSKQPGVPSASSARSANPIPKSVKNNDNWNQLASIVSSETGYPVSVLRPDMDLENDLGLDSIKKVELLSLLGEHFPALASVSPTGQEKTLADLAALTDKVQPGSAPGSAQFDSAQSTIFSVLATETGYPVEALTLEMDLENDLGLDSIKRVELLATISEQLGNFNLGAELQECVTLGQLTKCVEESMTTRKVPDFLALVARETGYPFEVLKPDMDLENDLGLDSIKKVELLAVLSDSRPELSTEEQTFLSQARTLGQWQDFFKTPPASTQILPVKPVSLTVSPPSHKGHNGRDLLEKALKSQPTLWQVEPVLYQPDSREETWPKGSFIRLVGSGGLTKSLERELTEQGYQVERRPWQFDFNLWDQEPRKASILILVWPGPDRNPELITQALLALEKAGDHLKTIVGLSFLGGFFGFPRPGVGRPSLGNSVSGALVGLLKCTAREWPDCRIKILDLPLALYESAPNSDWLTAILEAATNPGPLELGLPATDRLYNLSLQPYHPPVSQEPLLEPGQTVVVTGGGRGVTAAVLMELAKAWQPHLVILGRTPIGPPEPDWLSGLTTNKEIKEALLKASNGHSSPRELEAGTRLILFSRELKNNLAALRATGAQVDYLSGDFTQTHFIESTARQIRSRFGPIYGFIHGAGILADHPIKGKSLSDFARVYSTKTHLASLFLEAFQPEPLKMIVFFSSSTARFGRQGQGDYAAGNEVLNKTAWELSVLNPQCRVLALNWGPWDGGMVTESLAGQFKSQGVGLIGLKEGAETFVRLLKAPAGGPAEVVVLGHGTNLESLSSYLRGDPGQ